MKGLEALRDEVLACAADALTVTTIPRVDLYRVSQPDPAGRKKAAGGRTIHPLLRR